MALLVIKDIITSGEALVSGQTLQLGSFIMGARPDVEPQAAQLIVKNHVRIDPEYYALDPADVSALNELLDRIAALGVATDYDRIGLKPDQREIKSPPITHLVAVVEEQAENTSPSKLRTSYVWIFKPCVLETHLRVETGCPPNI